MGGAGNCGIESCDFDVDKISARRLVDVRSAVKAVLFTTLVFSVGESNARGHDYDPQLWQLINSNDVTPSIADRGIGDDPTRDDEGGWCTDAGCYIWADPGDPFGGAGGGIGGGGSGGTGSSSGGSGSPPPPPAIPISQLPDRDKLNCAANKYGDYKTKYPWTMDDIWAFTKGAQEAYSTSTSVPPPGFAVDEGVTNFGSEWPTGGQTILFASGLSAHSSDYYYKDPLTGADVKVPGPFTAFEWALITLAHELAHQNGVVSEDVAEQYGESVLHAYRADGGKQCP